MKKLNVKIITLSALLAALFVVLSFLSIQLPFIKITMQNLTIFIGGIYIGPISAALIGGIGMFISQLLQYGITITTIVWVLPYVIIGALCGILSKKLNFISLIAENNIKILFYLCGMNILLTLLNTISIYIDAKVFAYYSFAYVFGSFVVRIITSILTAVVYYIIIQVLNKYLCKYLSINL